MEDLGMSPISEQLSDKPPLAFVFYMDVRDIKHNRVKKLNTEHRSLGGRAPATDSRGSFRG
jgi:hypothetical protein